MTSRFTGPVPIPVPVHPASPPPPHTALSPQQPSPLDPGISKDLEAESAAAAVNFPVGDLH